MLRISGEIICEHFSPQTLRLVSNFDQTELGKPAPVPPPMMGHNGGPPMPPEMATGGVPPSPMPGAGGGIPPVPPPSVFDQAVALLKNDKLRGFRIDIEDQSTIAMDDEAEKAARVQFLKSVGDYISSAAQIPPQMAPAMLPLLGKLLLFGARAFRAGLEMETAIEDAITKLSEQAAQQAANPPPNPEMIKAQSEAQRSQEEISLKREQMQADNQRAMIETQAKAQESEANRQMAAQKMQHEAAQAQAQNAQDATEHQIAIDKAMLERERFQQEQLQADRDHQIALANLAIEQQRLELDRHKLTVDAAKAADDSDIKREGLKAKEAAK